MTEVPHRSFKKDEKKKKKSSRSYNGDDSKKLKQRRSRRREREQPSNAKILRSISPFPPALMVVLVGVVFIPFILNSQSSQSTNNNMSNDKHKDDFIEVQEKFSNIRGVQRQIISGAESFPVSTTFTPRSKVQNREPQQRVEDNDNNSNPPPISGAESFPVSTTFTPQSKVQDLEQRMKELEQRMEDNNNNRPLISGTESDERTQLQTPMALFESVQKAKIPEQQEIVIPKETNDKPKMHTFFQLANDSVAGNSATNEHLLQVWKSSWSEAGWEPVILNMTHARQHPKFTTFQAKLDEITFFLHTPVEYNKMCFYRWLAMAVVGGGWMSDFDVIPLPASYIGTTEQQQQEEYGDLTIHDMGTHPVPSLVSGSAVEWDRMSSTIFQAAVNQARMLVPSLVEGKTSDMLALQAAMASMELIQEVEAEPHTKMEFSKDNCNQLERFRAAHFSHTVVYAMLNDRSPTAVERRPELIREWIKEYKLKCHAQESSASNNNNNNNNYNDSKIVESLE